MADLLYNMFLCVIVSVVIFFFIFRSSRSRRLRLPPGSLGLPFVGETLQLIAAYKTENPEPFIDERVSRFGSIFTTHVFGEPTVFSADPETNRFILQNEGKLFECSYPGSISNLLGKHSLLLMKGSLHKRMHSLTMSFANSSIIKDHLLVDIDRLVRLNMDSWTDRVFLMEEAKKVTLLNLVTQTESIQRRIVRVNRRFYLYIFCVMIHVKNGGHAESESMVAICGWNHSLWFLLLNIKGISVCFIHVIIIIKYVLFY